MSTSHYTCGYKPKATPLPLPIVILGYFFVAATLAVALVG
jgi:hypothetical protein